MLDMDILAIVLGVILGLVHYFSETVHIAYPRVKKYLVSFAAGVSVTYLLIQLLPEVTLRLNVLQSHVPYLFILVGFVVFHLIEKFIYQHGKRQKIVSNIKELHAVSLFIYHLFVGVLLVYFVRINPMSAVLFTVPLFFNLSVSNVSFHRIHYTMKSHPVVIWLESAATLIGVFLALLISIPSTVVLGLASFIAGSLLFMVVRDSIPKESEGKPLFFVLGILCMVIVLYVVGALY